MPSYAVETLASAVGGASGLVLGAPLYFIKTHEQQSGGNRAGVVAAFNQQGVRGLFRGATPPLIGATLYQVVAFPMFKLCLDAISAAPEPSLGDMMLAGTGAGLASSLLTTPFEMVKVKLVLNPSGKPELRGAARAEVARLYSLGGVRALYSGLTAMAVREGPGSGLYFGIYHSSKRNLRAAGVAPTAADFVSGGVAGVSCWLSVLPFDVCKTRIQATSFVGHGASPQGKYRGGVFACARVIVREEGLGALYLGWRPLVARAFLVNSTTFLIYEQVLDVFR